MDTNGSARSDDPRCSHKLNGRPCIHTAMRFFEIPSGETEELRHPNFCGSHAEFFLAHCALFPDVEVREVPGSVFANSKTSR